MVTEQCGTKVSRKLRNGVLENNVVSELYRKKNQQKHNAENK